jgi:hypothetical protein
MKAINRSLIAVAVASIILTGCGTATMQDDSAMMQKELEAARAQAAKLEGEKNSLSSALSSRDSKIVSLEDQLKNQGGSLLPPEAAPGQCFARVFTPPRYETVTKTILHKAEGEVVKVRQPTYGYDEKQVLVRAESTRLKVIPAQYKWVEESIMVKEASEKLTVKPAVYRDVTEKVLVREAYSTWKRGRGPVEKIDHMTGEIMCLVEVPAEYKTVVQHKLVSPATTVRTKVPAVFQTIKKRVLVAEAHTVQETIPAVYKTVKVRKVATPGGETRTVIPATYQTVTDQVLASEGTLIWRPILCETNTTPGVVRRLQTALIREGYNPGDVDGVYGWETKAAMTKFQKDNGLASGQPTLEALKKLRVLYEI